MSVLPLVEDRVLWSCCSPRILGSSVVPRLRFLASVCGGEMVEEVSRRRFREWDGVVVAVAVAAVEVSSEVEWGWGAVDVRAEGADAGEEGACGPAVVMGECGGLSFSSSKA